MRAGRLRHQLTIQRPNGGTRDAAGKRITTYADVATDVWGRVEPLSSNDIYNAAQYNAQTTHSVTIRWSEEISEIESSWRVLFGVRTFVIDGIMNTDERNREIVLNCIEGERNE
jgi:SPP1 family predicted phage head-tail adaptor